MSLNWSGAGTGALAGAGTGAAFGPWGAAAGGVIGGALGLFGGAQNDRLKKIATGTKQQQALHNNILAQAMGMSQGGGGYDLANQYYNNFLNGNSQEAFNQFSAPYLQQFEEQVLPQIAERYAGVGALSSSGFGQAIGGASAGLQAQLAQLFSNLQSQAAQQQYGQYNQLAQTGLNYQPFAYNRQEGTMGFGAPFLNDLAGQTLKPIAAQGAKRIEDLFKPKAPIAAQAGGIG